MGLCSGRLFSHSKAVQPKLKRALAGKAILPENLWNWPQAPQAFLVLIQISESAALHPVIYGAFLHHKFCAVWARLPFFLHLWTKPVNTIIPPLTSKTDSMAAKHFKDSEKQITVSPSPSSHLLLPLPSLHSAAAKPSSLSPPAWAAVALSESSEFPIHCSVSTWKRHRCWHLVHYKKKREEEAYDGMKTSVMANKTLSVSQNISVTDYQSGGTQTQTPTRTSKYCTGEQELKRSCDYIGRCGKSTSVN